MEDIGVGTVLILKCIIMGWEGMDWIHLAQGTDKWQAVMKTVMNFWMS